MVANGKSNVAITPNLRPERCYTGVRSCQSRTGGAWRLGNDRGGAAGSDRPPEETALNRRVARPPRSWELAHLVSHTKITPPPQCQRSASPRAGQDEESGVIGPSTVPRER
jgi:hypothetical protein